MKGLHTDKILKSTIPFKGIVIDILNKSDITLELVEQFCDDGEGELNRYNVYKVTTNIGTYVLKKSDDGEIYVYEKFLKGKKLPVPKYYGNIEMDDKKWILLEYIVGTDLRDFTKEMAFACSNSITTIMNEYWQEKEIDFKSNRLDDRFERYWNRINKRARCLEKEPILKEAYEIFLERQLSCPRTLCNGDFLQYNGIFNNSSVILIDWAFAGIMPYSLDIARLIAHGTKDKRTFPFYMTDEYRNIYIQEVYSKLVNKPNLEQYQWDIKLSLLNEYIEFIESELINTSLERDRGFEYYYRQALSLAKEITKNYVPVELTK